jgi:Ran GTPase-activating protein (RanGAP) involved in mRNA processing and transport
MEKANVILDRMLADAKTRSVRSIRVPGFLQLSANWQQHTAHGIAVRNSDQVKKLAEILSHCSALTDLDLSQTQINGYHEDIAIIADQIQKCPSLTHLNLSLNRYLTAASFFEKLVVNLRDCRLLRELTLEAVEMEDEDLILLAQNLPQYQGLKLLNIANNEFGDDGITQLARFLPDCPKLSRLDIHKNQCHLSAMELVNGFLQILQKRHILFNDPLVLNLNDNWITPDDVEKIQDISDANENLIVLTFNQAV